METCSNQQHYAGQDSRTSCSPELAAAQFNLVSHSQAQFFLSGGRKKGLGTKLNSPTPNNQFYILRLKQKCVLRVFTSGHTK